MTHDTEERIATQLKRAQFAIARAMAELKASGGADLGLDAEEVQDMLLDLGKAHTIVSDAHYDTTGGDEETENLFAGMED